MSMNIINDWIYVKFDNGELYRLKYSDAVALMREHREPDNDEDLIDYLQGNVNWDDIRIRVELVSVDPSCAYDYDEEWPNARFQVVHEPQPARAPMKLINLTPHSIVIVLEDDDGVQTLVPIPPSGEVARIATETEEVTPIYLDDGTIIPVKRTSYTGIAGLPPQQPQVGYIVSRIVCDKVRAERYDVFAPGDLVRNAEGQPVGCLGLSC